MSIDESVTALVPSSTANTGPGFDIWAVGTEKPYLKVTCTKAESGVEIECRSPCQPPEGRVLGYSGRQAAKKLLRESGINGGAHILYEDSDGGYPVGGLGRSGAEIVGAVMALSVAYDLRLSLQELIELSFRVEGHPDNVAASMNGGFNIMTMSPYDDHLLVDSYELPENLGLAIGFSSHPKTGGTEEYRRVLKRPVPKNDLVYQTGLASMITAALLTGDTNRFLELVWGDRFHEKRRADARLYGGFNSREFEEIKRELFGRFHVGLSVSGAGNNMQIWYNKDEHPNGIVDKISPTFVPWFQNHGVGMRLKEMETAREGAYACAQRVYGYGKA